SRSPARATSSRAGSLWPAWYAAGWHVRCASSRAAGSPSWGASRPPTTTSSPAARRSRAATSRVSCCEGSSDEPRGARSPEPAGRPRHPTGVALADTAERFAIPREHFEAVIAGVEMDLRRDRYETWEDDLAAYCYRVAGAVGLVCIQVFGYRNPSARQYAVELGLAFQLTNILRDVAEDAQRGRIYLPRADLRQFGCREEDVLVGHCTEAFRQVMAFE